MALSSGEADLYNSVHGVKELAGFINVLRDRFGEDWCSIMSRRGAGGIKHLQVKDLWVQEAVRQYNINVVKIPREQNVADALASPSTSKDLEVKLTTVGGHLAFNSSRSLAGWYADINFLEKGNTDLCELQQNTWAPLPKPLVVDSGATQ